MANNLLDCVPTSKQSTRVAPVKIFSADDIVRIQVESSTSDNDSHIQESNEPRVMPHANACARRLSDGSASKTNVGHLRAKVRRLQQRKFRSQNKARTYVEHFLSLLYYIGMSPLEPKSAKLLPNWSRGLQKALYWCFAIASVIEAGQRMEFGWIQFRVDENMLNFITFGYLAANGLTRFYCIKVFASSSHTTDKLLAEFDQANDNTGDANDFRTWKVAVAVVSLALLLSTVSAVGGTLSLQNWSTTNAILVRSYDTSELIFVWSSNDWENLTDKLLDNYGTNLTATTVSFGAIGLLLNFCGTLHACVLLDLWPVFTIEMFYLQNQFSKTLRNEKSENVRCPLSKNWDRYMQLRDICDHTDDLYGKLLMIIHMQNMLLFGYFLLELLKKKSVSASFLIDMITVGKVLATYYFAQKSAEKATLSKFNNEYEACFTTCWKYSPVAEISGDTVSVPVVLREMEKSPIGIGRGEFFVNRAFILKLAGFVGSIFVLLSGESGESQKCTH